MKRIFKLKRKKEHKSVALYENKPLSATQSQLKSATFWGLITLALHFEMSQNFNFLYFYPENMLPNT